MTTTGSPLASPSCAGRYDPPDAGVVFIVDDDAAVGVALGRLVRSAGYRAEVFISAREFLDRHPACPDGCLLLDVHMPDMAGTALHDLLRARGWNLPVIFITGRDFPGGAEAAREMGAAAFFRKPVDAGGLLTAIASALEDGRATPPDRSSGNGGVA